MNFIISFVIRYPKTVIAIILLGAVLLGWNIPGLQIDPSLRSMLPKDEPIIVALDSLEAVFGGSEMVIVSIDAENIFDRSTIDKIHKMSDELENNEIVSRVMSITTAKDIVGSEEGFVVKDLIEEFPETSSEIDSLKEYIKTKDLIYGNIVSKDFTKTSIICTIAGSTIPDKLVFELFQKLKAKYQGPETIYLAGLPLTRHYVTKYMSLDMRRFLPYGIALMIILLILSFRSWAGVFLPLLVVILSIIYTFGLMAFLGVKFTFISVLIPVMLIAIANDYGIHIIAHYFHNVSENKNYQKQAVIVKTMSELGAPIFLAGITTLIGFMSLQSHVLPPVREMGLFSSFGILIAFIMSITLIPAILTLLPEVQATQRIRNEHTFARRFTAFIQRKRPWIISVFILLVIVSATGIPKVIVDTNPIHYFHKSSEIRKANDITDKYFGGATQLSIPVNGDIKSPQILHEMRKLQDYLETIPTVSRTISITDQVELMNKAFHSDNPEYETIPDSRNLIAQYFLLYSISGDPEDLDFLVDYEYTQAQIIARFNETSSTKLKQFIEEASDYIDENFDRSTFPTITGFGGMLGILVDKVVRGQMYSLLISLILVSLVTSLIFRSFQAGLYALIPIGAAIVLVFGLMGYFGIELNVATAMLSSILIGVGVDYTIHFLWRYRMMIRENHNFENALIQTMASSGKGITYNALSVIVGFTVLMFSGFLPINFFGFLITTSITTCWIGALVVLPAIVTRVKPAFITRFKKGE